MKFAVRDTLTGRRVARLVCPHVANGRVIKLPAGHTQFDGARTICAAANPDG